MIVPVWANRVDRQDGVDRHAPSFPVGNHAIHRLGELALHLAALESFGRKERRHEPELKDVVTKGRDHVDEAFPVGRAPAVDGHIEEHVRVESILQVFAEIDVADPHRKLRTIDHPAQVRADRSPLDVKRPEDLDEAVTAAQRRWRPAEKQFTALGIGHRLDDKTLWAHLLAGAHRLPGSEMFGQRIVSDGGHQVSSGSLPLLRPVDGQNRTGVSFNVTDNPVGRIADQFAIRPQDDIGRGTVVLDQLEGFYRSFAHRRQTVRPDVRRLKQERPECC